MFIIRGVCDLFLVICTCLCLSFHQNTISFTSIETLQLRYYLDYTGGACGWANDVKSAPFSAMIAAGNAKLFLKGKGCGTCYQVLKLELKFTID